MMESFNEVLYDLRGIIKENPRVFTLSQKKVNVADFSANAIFVQTDKSSEPQSVPVDWIKEVWNILVKKKKICASDLDGITQGRYRSSFIFALLSRLPYIDHEKVGRTTYIKIKK